jgi:hypothetical protein
MPLGPIVSTRHADMTRRLECIGGLVGVCEDRNAEEYDREYSRDATHA